MPTVLSPNMNLPVPVVGQEPGPQYATDVNNSLNIIDQHTHTSGSGVPITSNAIDINADLPINDQRLLLMKSATFTSQGSPLTALSPDINAVYVSGVDLYYNDGNGNQVRITQGGNVTGSSGSITGLVAPASASYVVADETFVWQSDVNTPASMDFGAAILRNITANSKGITLQPPNALAADYTLTLPGALQGFSGFLTVDSSGNISNSAPFPLTNASIANATIANAKLAPTNIVFSSGSGTFTTTGGTYVTVTNLTVTITTVGRPVALVIMPDPSAGFGFFTNGTANSSLGQRWFRDSTTAVSQSQIFLGPIGDQDHLGGASVVDYGVIGSPGVHTYEFQIQTFPAQIVGVTDAVIVAYEL